MDQAIFNRKLVLFVTLLCVLIARKSVFSLHKSELVMENQQSKFNLNYKEKDQFSWI